MWTQKTYSTKKKDNMKFDPTKPLFAVYISVRGLSRKIADDHIRYVMSQFTDMDICTVVLPLTESSGGDTRIECIYNPTVNKTYYQP
jgi:hypothetical protein